MPKVKANNLTMNYEEQGTGEPLILIPYLAADYACYAFQVADYAKHFTGASLSTSEGPVKRTKLKAAIPPKYSPTMWLPLCSL